MNHENQSSLARRDFLRLLALMGGAAALAACEKAGILPELSPTETGAPGVALTTPTTTAPAPQATPARQEPATAEPTPTQEAALTPTPNSNLSRVALVRTDDRARGVRTAIDLLSAIPVAGRTVFLKPNYNSSDPPPGSTHPDILRALVGRLREQGAAQITVGDRSGMGDTRTVMQSLGVFKMAEELDFKVVVFDELAAEDWVRFEPPGSHWKQGFRFPRPVLESEAVVQACNLKTHRYGGHFTLSLKNSVGLAAKSVPGESYSYMRELHNSPHQRRMIAEINYAYQPALVILDAVDGFSDGGPDRGTLIHPGAILAGSDRIALDAVGVAILRYFGTTREVSQGPIFQQEQIARAVEMRLGVSNPAQIELVTADQASADFAGELKKIIDQG